jgi:predicted O-methyltransferase YrrM
LDLPELHLGEFVTPRFNKGVTYSTRQKIISKTFRIIHKVGPKFVLGPNLSTFVLNYIDPYIYIDRWSSQPFNGQNSRYRQIVLISEFFKPTVAIETGTYLGTSTPALAKLVSRQAYTIEFVEGFAEKSKKRFNSKFNSLNITLLQGDSALLMKGILDKLDPDADGVLAYLDAHWQKEIPTRNELTALASWGGNWVAIIDDFKVPGDPSYGYDQYGEIAVDLTLIPNSQDIQVLVPKLTAETETGAKKGTAYVFGSIYKNIELVNEFPDLRKIEPLEK